MDWRDIGPYRGYEIWVRGRPDGTWVAAVVPVPSPPDASPTQVGPLDDRVLPQAFDSDAAAMTAAMRYINREQERRVQHDLAFREWKSPGAIAAGLRRRRCLRFPVALRVIALSSGGQTREFHGVVRNVGAGGLMAEFPALLGPGSVIDLLLQTRRGLMDLAARIVWSAASNGPVCHGLAFSLPRDESFAVGLFVGGSA